MTNYLYNGSNLDILPKLSSVDCIFADPFDNIGLGYDEYDDCLPEDEYRSLLAQWVSHFVLKAPIVWISFNARWTLALGSIMDAFIRSHKDWEFKSNVQVFTFGQHNNHDLGNNHRQLWRLRHKDAPLYPDAIRIPSWRQRNGDKRASPKGRVPGDVFDMQYRGKKVADSSKVKVGEETVATTGPVYFTPGDVFDFPRVTGNSKQRCDWHPTQLHEELVERCIKLSTKEGQRVLDPFGGTGTTLRVCKKINRACTLIELDGGYCDNIRKAHPDLKFPKKVVPTAA